MVRPNFDFEKRKWKQGYRIVAGIDEVGRGSFAGPVVAGCVIFREDIIIPEGIEINDSKKLRHRKRIKASIWIKESALSWGIGICSVAVINRFGIGKATKTAFRRAIGEARKRLGNTIDYVLSDAFYIPYVRGLRRKNQQPIIKGDTKSYSIAAASIIAKVHRDKIMVQLGKEHKFRHYRWAKNKGYGTKEHQEAIKNFGTTRYHRKAFVKNCVFSLAQ
jgi:ribonuclease HII